jgi:WD40 repeat protein
VTSSLNGTELELEDNETSHIVVVKGERLLVGAEWTLRLFDKAGSQLWSQNTPGAAWAVNLSLDGRLAVAALGDGTIRWYRMSDGAELLALFPHVDVQRWVAWTPQGHYNASTGADELIGWHVNRGKDHEADFFPAKQFSEKFNRPDIVVLVLDTLDVDEAARNPRKRLVTPTLR